ncbi:undecaprenyl-diphosphatase [Paenibacillus selenitireducens]|jgi:undecaprenyl-diphosphatase|uniref:Undecaprenyl-diphosphatase n=1 Tax=Paenibacillus selenitireducens TaxID=1324314 RepID=A0A1T2XLT5_9BACL|nr:undecaprenyl-diphosphate phosphatase [Paenibacillus selenitireducens]OPA80829.1 undecaprenyl-diphosphatase [Paenibacillus selenitireducens]
MDSILVAIILGIVEGLTEFIPVSSTGHMILTDKIIHPDVPQNLLSSFEVIIQLAAILAIAIVYRERIFQLFGLKKSSRESTSTSTSRVQKPRLNLIHVFLGIAPALITAFFARDYIKSKFESSSTVLWALVVGGLFMIFAEFFSRNRVKLTAPDMDDITYKQAFLIGIYQILSVVWPGFSRSGSTMSGGMLSGVSYRASADFSFLIAIPIMCAASGYELLDNYKVILEGDWLFFLVGFIVSFVVAYIVVVWFLKHIQKIQLRHFAYYRFIVALLFWFFILR